MDGCLACLANSGTELTSSCFDCLFGRFIPGALPEAMLKCLACVTSPTSRCAPFYVLAECQHTSARPERSYLAHQTSRSAKAREPGAMHHEACRKGPLCARGPGRSGAGESACGTCVGVRNAADYNTCASCTQALGPGETHLCVHLC